MEIRHLISFLQVAALHSFTKAGETLGYSQANISTQIRQLESEVGVPLFDRVGKRANLTQYGQQLIPYAQQIVATSTTIETMFREKKALSGSLRVGFVESLFECLFRDTMLNYHRQFPLVTVEVTVDATSELLKRLHSGQLDAVCLIDSDLVDPDIHYWSSIECSVVIVANSRHPLSQRRQLEIGDLEGREFVLMEDSAPYILEFNRWLQRRNIQINPFIKVQSPEGALKLLSDTDYLSILPDYSVKGAICSGRMKRLDIDGFSQRQNVQFLVHKNKVLTPQIEGFLQEARTTFLAYAAADEEHTDTDETGGEHGN